MRARLTDVAPDGRAGLAGTPATVGNVGHRKKRRPPDETPGTG